MFEIKPIYNTGTITFIESPEKITLKKIDSSYVKDPEGVIPNGIYKVFNHEKNKNNFLIIFTSILTFISILLITLFATVWKTIINGFWYFPVSLGGVLAAWKLITILLDARHLKQSINIYRESLLAGSRLTPPFISNLYIKLFKSQARQNWIVIAFLFYGIIFTLLFWWLKDESWWIFDFKGWINSITSSPEWIGFMLIALLSITLVMHIFFTTYRKKRIIDIQSFFGNEVISQVEIDEIVRNKNKIYRRVFFISILVVLVLPFVGWIIYKKLIRKS